MAWDTYNEWYTGTGGDDTTGDGTSHATRWLTVQKALDSMTTGQRNRLNCTGSETLSSTLNLTTYGSPGLGTELLIQGYTSTAGDGGVFAINGGTNSIFNEGKPNIGWRNLKFTNWGSSNRCINTGGANVITECEFDGEGSHALVGDFEGFFTFANNKVHGIVGSSTSATFNLNGGYFANNYIQQDSATQAHDTLYVQGGSMRIESNVFSLNTTVAVKVINLISDNNQVYHNTIFNQAACTGTGINLGRTTDDYGSAYNNIICGFSGTGGVGIKSTVQTVNLYGNNKFWNNTTDEDVVGDLIIDIGGSESLLSNPFTSTGNADHNDDDFTLLSGVRGDAWSGGLYDPDDAFGSRNLNTRDVGALQSAAAGGGGGGLLRVNMNGNVFG